MAVVHRLLGLAWACVGLETTVPVAKLALPTEKRQALRVRVAVVYHLLGWAGASAGLEVTVLVAKPALTAAET